MGNPSANYSYEDDRSRSSGKAVVGWLKLKAALRWGIFIRKKAAEKRAQLHLAPQAPVFPWIIIPTSENLPACTVLACTIDETGSFVEVFVVRFDLVERFDFEKRIWW
ncbi:hypothetical protein Patl1_10878 [Pistacia atlantica]|uniref:Uncharacterized protein n=1 Tax=Pistacia atlantica TaxID=434234 RepID=A0ACC1A7E4_9ROSI|nr:hypothetical protein Patl1_10878 [Pistacia atlantica]